MFSVPSTISHYSDYTNYLEICINRFSVGREIIILYLINIDPAKKKAAQ